MTKGGVFFFFNDAATTEIYTLSLHDALPIYTQSGPLQRRFNLATVVFYTAAGANQIPELAAPVAAEVRDRRSEEHTSELQSRQYLVCRLLLEKKENTLLVTTSAPNALLTSSL